MSTALTKLDVARRQLAVAIQLFFDDRDAISVHTLAANSWEIVDLLCKNREVDSFSKHARENLPNGKLLKRDFINQLYRNFFKHADEKPEGTVEGFSDDKNDHILFLAVEDLVRLEQPALFECLVFQIWYLAVYEEKIATEDLERVLPTIRDAFPNIRNLSRLEQKRLGRGFYKNLARTSRCLLTHEPTCQRLTGGRVDYRNEGCAKRRMKQQNWGHIIPWHLEDLAIVVMCNMY